MNIAKSELENPSGNRGLPAWQKAILLCAAYFVAAEAGGFLSRFQSGYVSFWLPAGVYFAALLLNGRKDWLWLIPGALAANIVFDLSQGIPIAASLALCCANTLQACFGAWLTVRLVRKRPTLATFREYAALLVSVVISSVLGAFAGASTLVCFHINPSFFHAWENWWSGNAMALLLIVPFATTLVPGSQGPPPPRPNKLNAILEAILLVCVLLGISSYLLFFKQGVMTVNKTALLLPLMWAGIRFGPRGAASIGLLLAFYFAFFTAHYSIGLTAAQAMSGEPMFVLQSSMIVAALTGMIPAIIIRERDSALVGLRASEDRYELAIRGTLDGIWDWNVLTGEVFHSHRYHELLGYEDGGFPPGFDAFKSAIHPDDRERAIKAIEDHLERHVPYDVEFRLRTKAGDYRWFRSRGQAIWDGQGRAVRMAGSIRDVTKGKEAERALRESEEKFSKAFSASPNGMCISEMKTGRLLEVNESYCHLYGYRRDELIGRNTVELGIFKTPETRTGFVQALLEQGSIRDFEVATCRSDGQTRIVSTSAERIELGESDCIVSVIYDITERKKAEEQLQRREERFRSLIENASDMITEMNHDAVIAFQSPSSERILGFKPAEVVGRVAFEIIHPEDADKAREAFASALARPGVPVTVVVRLRHRDGTWRLVEAIGRSLPNATEEEGSIILNARDITESTKLEEQVLQAQKMEAVGQLAGGIAHDFNNMLAVIQMQTSLLLTNDEVGPHAKDELQNIMAAAERSANLTRQLLTFSRREVKRAEDLDLAEVIGTIIKLLRRVLGENIDLATRFASGLPIVKADPGMIEQVMMNLAINARDAMPRGGKMEVALESCEIDPERAASHQSPPGRFVCVAIADTGCGIPADVLPRIFEPFFTTKRVGEGTGLGLATTFGIVQQHQGWIEVSSEVGRGTTFRVYLPALEGVAAQHAPVAVGHQVRGGSETVLLVEDDAAVRNLTRHVLDHFGYKVMEASGPLDALQIWSTHGKGIDLLLTDIVMPGGMNGRELADEILALRPGLKVIYLSGYSNELINEQLHLEPGRNFLQKPFSALELASSVRRCFDEG